VNHIASKVISLEQLVTFNFKKGGSWVKSDERLLFIHDNQSIEHQSSPKVYLWLCFRESEIEVIYVGKTRYDLKKRMNQHRQGFKGKRYNGSTSGSTKFHSLKSFINDGFEIQVWYRIAEIVPIQINAIHYTEMSNFSVEEEFFIDHFEPKLNAHYSRVKP
jgi:hypothetical protein